MHDAAKSSERPISSPEMSADGYPGASSDRGSRSLSIAALIFVAMAAVMGWGASFVGLHEYGMQSMAGFTYWSAWLVPATFDGAAFACTLMTYRSSINGRSAVRGRILMWAFTGVSSWINWIHQPSHEAQIVAAGLPIAAVAVFDVVLLELRADYEAKHGMRGFRLRPGLLVLRWMVDRRSTSEAFRKQVIDIPVEEIAGLGTLAPPGTRRAAALKAAARAEEEQYANERANADLVTAAPARQEASEDTGAANSPHGVDAEQPTAASRPADRPEVTASTAAAEAPRTSTTSDTAPAAPPVAEPETESVTRPVREMAGASAAATATSTVSARTGASTKDAADAETARTETETAATAGKPEEPATAPVTSKSTAKGSGAKAAKSGSGKNAETTVHGAEAATVTIELPKVSTEAKSAPAKDETAAKAESSPEPEAPAKDETAKGGTATTSTGAAKSTATATAANSKSSGDADKSSAKAKDADTVSDSEQTLTLPPVPDGPLSDRDRRSAARADYRKSVEADQPVKPAELGKRYGLSESWGRRQINAVRKSMAQEQAQDPADLVGAAKS
ncbi:DUF2637 domain-containing protein [Saccharopolyspora sp. NFXS83]|uniref:DUF2637 domain-containing protein n=1 Tax=Saccharopolyspora sp. NFXS83 TaxID=2993560 RepID=UPI00224B83A1|nr:DUF2637 domain-containing protein [Saccharopolyspora sp. NFXS83]MCX2734123.1 DUF2637 domain-containing protein [Saccharopolyspora sp. NFXS83]